MTCKDYMILNVFCKQRDCVCVLMSKELFFSRSTTGQSIHFDSIVADCVLPLAGRDHPTHVTRGTAPW